MQPRLVIVGFGNVGHAIVRGAIESGIAAPSEIGVMDPEPTRIDEAREMARRALAGRKANGKNPVNTAKTMVLLSKIDEARSDLASATRTQRDAVDLLRTAMPQGGPETTAAVGRLGHLLILQGLMNDAEPLLLEAISSATREGEPAKAILEQAQADLARLRAPGATRETR